MYVPILWAREARVECRFNRRAFDENNNLISIEIILVTFCSLFKNI